MQPDVRRAGPLHDHGSRIRRWLRRLWKTLARWQPPARLLHTFAWAALLSNGLISVTGAIVRVTGSGLGCTTWPDCQPGTLVPEYRTGMAAIHQAIEFGNRTITGLVLVASLGTFLLVALIRPFRRQLVWLAAVGPIGVLFQAVWGGILVHLSLAWWAVAPHLLASLVLVFFASIVVVRLGESDVHRRLVAPRPLTVLTWATAAVLAAVTVSGSLVTATGPHAGDVNTPRLGWDLREAAQLHADLMFLYLGLIAALGVALVATSAPRVLKRRIGWLIGLTAAQGALGLTQYFLGVPEVLVVLHVLGAVVLTAVAAFACMATRERPAMAESAAS
jgi:cytochrome c oxidase assembly protein subunit 15